VDIRDNGTVDGDLLAPRVAIADGAHFRGAIDMQKQPARADGKPAETRPAEAKPAEAKPAPPPAPTAASVAR
jgi:cytoskeletal protein CcmA (bactofilin family)